MFSSKIARIYDVLSALRAGIWSLLRRVYILLLGTLKPLFLAYAILSSYSAVAESPTVEMIYQENCSGCHGERLMGGTGGSLVDGNWRYGGSDEDLQRVIASGITDAGMPGFSPALSADTIRALVIFLREQA